jgi:hypothetical protein
MAHGFSALGAKVVLWDIDDNGLKKVGKILPIFTNSGFHLSSPLKQTLNFCHFLHLFPKLFGISCRNQGKRRRGLYLLL